jgi:hypothetical protein
VVAGAAAQQLHVRLRPLPHTQVDKFFAECDPERDNLCLYGLPDGTWSVDLPAEEVPPEIPEPALGINFARDGMQVCSCGRACVRGSCERAARQAHWQLQSAANMHTRTAVDWPGCLAAGNTLTRAPVPLPRTTNSARTGWR